MWGEELAHSWLAFEEAGLQVELASPRGGRIEIDAYSDPRNPDGGAVEDLRTLAFLERPDMIGRLEATLPVAGLSPESYDAILLLGGLGPVFTFRGDPDLQALFLAFHDEGKVAATLCHGAALLLDLRTPEGRPFIEGRRMTGFTAAEETILDRNIGMSRFNPYWIEEEAKALGADFQSGPPYEAFVMADGLLITGQQQQSSALLARTILAALADKVG